MPKRILLYGLWSLTAGIFFFASLSGIASELRTGSLISAGVTVIIHAIFAISFLIGGAGILMMKEWARKLMVYTAVAFIIVTVGAESAVYVASQLSAEFHEDIHYMRTLAIPFLHFLITLFALIPASARAYFR